MRLVSAVLGFALRKTGLLAALVLSLFLGHLLVQTFVPTLREAVAERERLQQVTADRAALEDDLERLRRTAAEGQSRAIASLQSRVDAEVARTRRTVTDQRAAVERLSDREDDLCGVVQEALSWVLPGNACRAAQRAAEKADAALDAFERNLARAEEQAAVLDDPTLTPQQKLARLEEGGGRSPVEREIDNTERALDQKRAEERSLQQAQASVVGRVVDQWARSWRWLVTIAVLVLVLPPALRVVSYFVLMPVVSRRHVPIHLAAGSEQATADLRSTPAQRTLTVDLGAGEVLLARSEHVRPVQGTVRSQLLYRWTSPFISFAAGLYGLSRVTGGPGGSSATLATPDDPDSYLMRIDFADHPGVVVHPRHVVGVLGAPDLQTRWRWGLQALATWQVRYIMFTGSGSLVVQGSGDVVATNPRGGSTRMEQDLVMGFDSRLRVGVDRTEVFWPYLWRKAPLVDDAFTGAHPFFWQKSRADGPSNPVARTFGAFFSALGKLFGF